MRARRRDTYGVFAPGQVIGLGVPSGLDIVSVSSLSTLLYADFQGLPLGAYSGTLPGGLSLTRDSVATVQTSASTVDSTPGLNVPRIGSLGLGWQGLVLEESRINYTVASRTASTWTSGSGDTYTLNSGNVTAPDGAAVWAFRDQVPSGTYGRNYAPVMTASVPATATVWMRADTGIVMGRPRAGLSIPAANGVALTTTWQRFTWTAASNDYTANVVDANEGRAVGGYSVAGACDGWQDFWQTELGSFGTEAIVTTSATATRAADELSYSTPANLIDNGRLSIEIWLRPKGARGEYTSQCQLWYMGASNQAWIDVNGQLHVMVGGVQVDCGSLSWAAQEQIKIFVAAGNGATTASYEDGSGTTYQIACPSTPLPPITPGGSIKILNLNAINVFTAWVQRIAFWRSDSMPFAPNQISGNVLWLRADQKVTLNGTTVSQWDDLSGNGHNVSQATAGIQPAYHASGGSNGQPYLTFSTAIDSVLVGSPATPLTDATNWTIFAVQQASSTTMSGVSVAVGSQTAVNGYALSTNGGTRNVLQQALKFCPDGAQTTAWEIWSAQGGTDVSLSVNGVAQALSGASNQINTPTAALRIGSRDVPDYYWDGGIAEVIIYDRILSASEIAQVTSYLGQRYGITV